MPLAVSEIPCPIVLAPLSTCRVASLSFWSPVARAADVDDTTRSDANSIRPVMGVISGLPSAPTVVPRDAHGAHDRRERVRATPSAGGSQLDHVERGHGLQEALEL